MAEHDEEHEPREVNQWDYSNFREMVIDGVTRHDVPMAHLPKKIDLTDSVIQMKGDVLIRDTMNDPRRRERSVYAKVPVDERKILISNKVVIGEESHVAQEISLSKELDMNRMAFRQTEYPAFTVHTHGSADVPPSPGDVYNLLLTTEDGGLQCELVLTPSIKYLMIRTDKTPLLSAENAMAISQEWQRKIQQEIHSELADFSKFMKSYGGVSETKSSEVQSSIQQKYFKEYCEKYGIKIYSAVGDSYVFSEITA